LVVTAVCNLEPGFSRRYALTAFLLKPSVLSLRLTFCQSSSNSCLQLDGDGFRNHLLRNFGIEIGNGLGELSGKVWRIGLMGYNSSEQNVDRLLNLFDTELKKYTIFESSTF